MNLILICALHVLSLLKMVDWLLGDVCGLVIGVCVQMVLIVPILGCIDVGAWTYKLPVSLASRNVLVAPVSALMVMISCLGFMGRVDTTGL